MKQFSLRCDALYDEGRFQLAQLAYDRQLWGEAETWLLEIHRGAKGLSSEGFDLLASIFEHQGKMFQALITSTQAVKLEDRPAFRLHLVDLQKLNGRDTMLRNKNKNKPLDPHFVP